MTKLLKTNTAAENLELVRACGTREEMTELLNTATVKMLLEFNEILNACAKKSDKKPEIINRIVSRLLDEREVEKFKKMSVDKRAKYLIANKKSQLNLLNHCDVDEFEALVQALRLYGGGSKVAELAIAIWKDKENREIQALSVDEKVKKLFELLSYQQYKVIQNSTDEELRLIASLLGASDEEIEKCEINFKDEIKRVILEKISPKCEVLKFEVGATYIEVLDDTEYEVIAKSDNEVIFKNKIGNFLRGVISIHDGAEYAKIGIDNYFLDGAQIILSARLKSKPAREISLNEAEENLHDAIIELKELENSDHSLDDLKKYDFPDDDYDNYSHLIVPLRKVEEYRRIVECLCNYFEELHGNSNDDIPQFMSQFESKTPEEQEKILESCSNDFLEDLCWAYGYKPNEDKKIMASLLARSQKSVQAKIQAIEEFLPIARENFNFFTHIDKKEQAESYSLCLKRLEALLNFYQQELIRSNKL